MRTKLIIALLLLIVAKIALLIGRGPSPIVNDARGYWELSSLVMSGDPLMLGEEIAFRTPIYPWFLALVRCLPSPLLATAIIQGCLYIAAVYMAAWLAAFISGRQSAKVFTLLALLPAVSAITYIGATLTETLFVFLLMLNLVTVANYTQQASKLNATLVGITFGLTLLTRPVVQLMWVAHVVLVCVLYRRQRKPSPNKEKTHSGPGTEANLGLVTHAKNMLLAAAVVIAFAVPWVGRNYVVFGKPFLTEFLGRNIWIVTFQDGSGAGLDLPDTPQSQELVQRLRPVTAAEDVDNTQSGSLDGINWRHTWTVSNRLVESGLNDAESDQLMKQVALSAMKQDPATASYKSVRRIVNFWRCPATDLPEPQPDFEGFENYPATWEMSAAAKSVGDRWVQSRLSQSILGNTILSALIAAACLFLIGRHSTRPFGVWITLILVYFCVLTGLVEIPDYRYRMVVEPIAAMAIGSVLAIGWETFRGKEIEMEMETSS